MSVNDKFFDLKKEKQDRIINASLKIFALNGYSRASTDEIVKEAEISKGLLFHYFISKKGLYKFVFDYSVKYTSMELFRGISFKEDDFFEIQKQMEQVHIQIMRNYPYMQQFIEKAFLETEVEVLQEVFELMEFLTERTNQIYEKVNPDKFKEGIDPEMVLTIVKYTIKGLVADTFRNEKKVNLQNLQQEIQSYLDLMKINFYKDSELDYKDSELDGIDKYSAI